MKRSNCGLNKHLDRLVDRKGNNIDLLYEALHLYKQNTWWPKVPWEFLGPGLFCESFVNKLFNNLYACVYEMMTPVNTTKIEF